MNTLVLILSLLSTPAATSDSWQQVGQAKLSVLFWDIYVSRLYSLDGQYQSLNGPLLLRITYLRDIEADDLLDATQDEWDKLGLDKQQTQTWLKELKQIWPDIKENQELSLVLAEDGSSEFYFNQAPIGAIRDKAFGASFLSIWLSPDTSYPALREQLIGVRP